MVSAAESLEWGLGKAYESTDEQEALDTIMATITRERSTMRDRADRHGLAGNKIWHHCAPAAIANSCQPGQPGKGWRSWCRHLATRTRPRPIERLVRDTRSPLLWNLPDGLELAGRVDLVIALAQPGDRGADSAEMCRDRLTNWLAQMDQKPIDTASAIEAVALAHHLPQLAEQLPAELWWELLEWLLALATDATPLDLLQEPLLTQLLAGELPLVLAYLFPELKPCRRLGKEARQALAAGIDELLDGQGLPHSRYFRQWRPLMACWTRCRAMGETLKRGCWNQQTENQYGWLVTQLIRFSRHDGSQVLSNGSSAEWSPGLFSTALDLSDDEADRAATDRSLPRLGKKQRSTKRLRSVELPEPAINSEWSGLAILRPSWKRSGERLAVQYEGHTVRIELSSGRDMVLRGTWDYGVQLAGTPLLPTGQWEEICWETDDEVDYLELEISLQQGVRLQRQMAFARADHCLYLADVILGPSSSAAIDYSGSLPLGLDVTYDPAEETWEGYLIGGKRRALVLPLGLPEWRAAGSRGGLSASDGHLRLEGHGKGRNLCCPLLLDLHPQRLSRQRTWRQLTVASKLQIQSADTAVGYRAQCGRDQWLIYRSLAPPTNRTVLGQELLCDFLMGRFLRTGEIEEIVEVE